jgi:7-cyano-7-deazaguanine synthase
MEKKSSVVLLSGGLDSSVNLYCACKESHVALALTFDYGQRAAKREIQSAQAQCKKLSVPHKIIELPWFKDFTQTSLVNTKQVVPSHVHIDDIDETQASAKSVWVPNRNGIFLNIAAAFAENLNAHFVVPGFNREEASTFPDNSEDFMDAISDSLGYSTATQVAVFCYTADKDKTEIAKMGYDLGVDFSLMWPCYHGEEKPCGICESCLRFQRAVRKYSP